MLLTAKNCNYNAFVTGTFNICIMKVLQQGEQTQCIQVCIEGLEYNTGIYTGYKKKYIPGRITSNQILPMSSEHSDANCELEIIKFEIGNYQ